MNVKDKILPFLSFSSLSLFGQGLVFLFNILVANKLSIEEYGEYSLIISIVSLILLFACQWHTSMMQYCGSAEFASLGCVKVTNQIRNTLFIICFTVICTLCFIFRPQLASYIGEDLVIIILILALSKCFQELISSYLIAIGKRQYSAINLFAVESICLLLLFVFKVSLRNILYIQIVGNFLCMLMIPALAKDDFKIKRLSKQEIYPPLIFATWQLLGSLAVFLISYGDNFIIKVYLTDNEIGVYNAAYKIFNALFLASNTIATYYISPLCKALTKEDSFTIKNIFFKERIVIFLACIILHILLYILTPQLFHLFYAEKYDSSIPFFRLLLFASLIRYWVVFEMLFLNSIGKIRIQQLLNVISAVLKIILSLVLIQILGLIGVVWGTVIASALTALISILLTEKKILNRSRI